MSAACLFSLHLFLHFSITLSPLLIPLADPQREPREWVGLKRERRAVLYPARSSLARLKRSERGNKKKAQHTGEESFSLTLLFSFLHLSTLLFHHSWVVWYITFTLLQQGLGSNVSERKLVSPLSYTVIPLFLFPLPLPFLLSVTCSSLVFKQIITVMFSVLATERRGGNKRCWNTPTDTHIFTNNVQCALTCTGSCLWCDCTYVYASIPV